MSAIFADLYAGDGSFDAHVYASAGHPFIVLKASEGLSFVDKMHAGRVRDAHTAGLPVGHYHFARPEEGEASKQAAHFATIVREHGLTIGDGHGRRGDFLICDIETGGPAHAARWYHEFAGNLAHQIPAATLVGYTYLSYMQSAPGLQACSQRWWLAAYGPRRPRLSRWRYFGGLWAWQYTDGKDGPEPHRASGVGECDLSILNPRSARYYKR